jgi:hypothetical protein
MKGRGVQVLRTAPDGYRMFTFTCIRANLHPKSSARYYPTKPDNSECRPTAGHGLRIGRNRAMEPQNSCLERVE